MSDKRFIGRQSVTLALLIFGFSLGAALAQQETVLYSFCPQRRCPDGSGPEAGIILDQQGNLYGTTSNGGGSQFCGNVGCGVVFKLTPEGKETVLHSFCTQQGCPDGAFPYAGLVFDQGSLYGTTTQGGAYGNGTVFKITPEGKETVLHSFCAQQGCPDGAGPDGGLVVDPKGNLYGTTVGGGASLNGTVFKLTPEGKETVLHSFCGQPCGDGIEPEAGLAFDRQGNLYGTTSLGGNSQGCSGVGCGTVFKLTPEGKETVLYSFCAQTNCVDGYLPSSGVVLDRMGNLYGTTYQGGAAGQFGWGVAFKVTPEGKETAYSFCAQTNCADGSIPSGGLVFGPSGNLYGTTNGGGRNQVGVVFEITPEGKETVLHNFGTQNDDGQAPQAGLVFDRQGNLYGTTTVGGANHGGVVFKLAP